MKIIYTVICILCYQYISAQVQVGQDIDGEHPLDTSAADVAFSNDGSIIAVGAPRPFGFSNADPGPGSVKVYVYDNGFWNSMGQKLEGSIDDKEFGTAVSLSSDGLTLAIGIPGENRVLLYKFEVDRWEQLGNDLLGDFVNGENAYFGGSVSLSDDGTIVAVGANGRGYNAGFNFVNGYGYVRSYQYDSQSDSWVQLGQELNPANADSRFGTDVSLSGDGTRLAIVRGLDTSVPVLPKATIVYEYDGSQWLPLGNEIIGFRESNQVFLSNDGTTVAIGSSNYNPPNPGSSSFEGGAQVYSFDGNDWIQKGQDLVGKISDQMGSSVSLSNDGNILAVGSSGDDNGNRDTQWNIGSVTLYTFNGGLWKPLGNKIYGETVGDGAGASSVLSDDGTHIAVGAPRNDAETGVLGNRNGHVRVYQIFDDLTLNVPEVHVENPVVLFPNPTKDKFSVSSELEVESIRIYTTTGKLMFEIYNDFSNIDLQQYVDGIFFTEIVTKKESVFHKILKKS